MRLLPWPILLYWHHFTLRIISTVSYQDKQDSTLVSRMRKSQCQRLYPLCHIKKQQDLFMLCLSSTNLFHQQNLQLLYVQNPVLFFEDFVWLWGSFGPFRESNLVKSLTIFFSGQSQALGNETNSSFPETETYNQRKTLVKIWNISTFLGVSGTILNGIILLNFYQERKAIFTVVNVMIW